MSKTYIMKESEGILSYDEAIFLKSASAIRVVDHPTRIRILKMLAKEPAYPAALARELKMHEQKVYYHMKLLANAGILEIVEKKQIRGTVAKKFRPKELNFALSLNPNWKNIKGLLSETADKKTSQFLHPFIDNDKLNAKIVVGSPDPHGPFKARARDGHYSIDLAYYLGSMSSISRDFSTMLDVDIKLKTEESNLIVVGGPVTNLVMAKINEFLPARFSDEKPWGITGKQTYTEENTGLIAKIPNPHNPRYWILAVAGVRQSGTKAAVIGLTRYSNLILSRYSGQKEFYAILEGYDMDGDGRIDSVELHE